MLRQFISLILILVSLAGATLDAGAALSGAELNSTSSIMGASHETAPSGHESVLAADHPSEDGMAASEACHDCHIGHCCFILPSLSIVDSALSLNPLDFIRSDILPNDLVTFIPRPPSTPALV